MLPASREVFFAESAKFAFGVAFRIVRHRRLSIRSEGYRITDKGMHRVCFVADHQQVRVPGPDARGPLFPGDATRRQMTGDGPKQAVCQTAIH